MEDRGSGMKRWWADVRVLAGVVSVLLAVSGFLFYVLELRNNWVQIVLGGCIVGALVGIGGSVMVKGRMVGERKTVFLFWALILCGLFFLLMAGIAGVRLSRGEGSYQIFAVIGGVVFALVMVGMALRVRKEG